MRQIKSCGVLIVRGEPIREVLLMRHPHRWDIPKGHIDEGETDIQCALRELEEETGITAEQVEIDPRFCFRMGYPIRHRRTGEDCQKTIVVYLGRLLAEVTICPSEHEDFHWLAWQPPHQVQRETIDPLLAALAQHVGQASTPGDD